MIQYSSYLMAVKHAAQPAEPKQPEHHSPETLDDVIKHHREQAGKLQEAVSHYDDPQWIASRKAVLRQKIQDLQKEIEILEKLPPAA